MYEKNPEQALLQQVECLQQHRQLVLQWVGQPHLEPPQLAVLVQQAQEQARQVVSPPLVLALG